MIRKIITLTATMISITISISTGETVIIPVWMHITIPDRGGSRNILASNIGLIAKKGEDNILHVMANDLITAMPLNGVTVDVYRFPDAADNFRYY